MSEKKGKKKPVLQTLMDTLYDRMLKDHALQSQTEAAERRHGENTIAPTFKQIKEEQAKKEALKRTKMARREMGMSQRLRDNRAVHRSSSTVPPARPPQNTTSEFGRAATSLADLPRIHEPTHPWFGGDIDTPGGDSFKVPPVKYCKFLSFSATQNLPGAGWSVASQGEFESRQAAARYIERHPPERRRLPRAEVSFFPVMPPVASRGYQRPKKFHEMNQRDLHDTFLLSAAQRTRVGQVIMNHRDPLKSKSDLQAESQELIKSKLKQDDMERAGMPLWQPQGKYRSHPATLKVTSASAAYHTVDIPIGAAASRQMTSSSQTSSSQKQKFI